MQIPGKKLAAVYNTNIFNEVMQGWPRYHIYGADQFVNAFTKRFGLPEGLNEITLLNM
jgi:hypothetical protein